MFLLLNNKKKNNCRGFQRWLVGKHTCCLSIRALAKILGSHIKPLHLGICRHIRSEWRETGKAGWSSVQSGVDLHTFPNSPLPWKQMMSAGLHLSPYFYSQRVTTANTQRQRRERNPERDWLRPWRQTVLPDRQKAWETKMKGLKTKCKPGKPGVAVFANSLWRALLLLLCL